MSALKYILLATAFAATASHAQQTPPPASEPRPFQLPTPTRISLPNGIDVTFVEFGVVPKVTIAISVRTGNLNEGGKTWLAAFDTADARFRRILFVAHREEILNQAVATGSPP